MTADRAIPAAVEKAGAERCHEPLELEVQTGDDTRLLIKTWTNQAGRQLVTVAPEYMDRAGAWHLARSGLLLAPTAARALAPALVSMAATIDEATT